MNQLSEENLYRPVKVESLNGMNSNQVYIQMNENARNGLKPEWKEFPEADTVPLDLTTVWNHEMPSGNTIQVHQLTIPLPLDDFPNLLKRMTATEAYERAVSIILREHWQHNYSSIMSALNHMEESLIHD